MLNFLKNKLNKLKKLEEKKELEEHEKLEDNSDKIIISGYDDIIKIDIIEEVTMNDFCIASDKSELIKDLFIPIRVLITKDGSRKIDKLTTYIFSNKEYYYYITYGETKTIISGRKKVFEEDEPLEYETIVELEGDKYLVYECVHTMNHSTRTVKWYPETNDNLKVFLLDGEKAYFLVMDMIDNLSSSLKIDKLFDIELLKNTLVQINKSLNKEDINVLKK